MSELITRTAKLQPRVKRTKSLPSYATTYVFEADDYPELGSLYVVVEVLVPPKQGQALADVLIETIGENYYNSDHKGDLLQRFEKSIKATNKALSDYTEKGNASWVGRISAIIAVIADDEIHITQTGSAEAHLYRGGRVSHITDGLQATGPHRPITTFGGIASGELSLHDRLVIATPALFHQLGSTDVKGIIEDSTANGAVTKLSELLQTHEDADRVAALVVEMSTAEHLAMSTLPSEPDEVAIGAPDKPLDLAKAAAGPAVDSILGKSKDIGATVSHHAANTVLPAARKGALGAAAWLRAQLAKPTGRRNAGIIVGIVLVAAGYLVYANNTAHKFDTQLKTYDQAYTDYQRALESEATGDKESAIKTLESAQKSLLGLSKASGRKELDSRISNRSHPENDPASIDGLLSAITAELDKIAGLATLKPGQIASLSQKPLALEVVGTKILIMYENGVVQSFDTQTNKLTTLAEQSDGIGTIVASTASSNNDGVYVLTKKPSVWLVKLDGTVTEQTLASGEWAPGRSIASYAGNLYILAEDGGQIYKHVPTSAGFSAKAAYFNTATTAEIAGSTSIAVDGYIYTAGSYGVKRFVSGKLDASVTLDSNLRSPIALHSLASGSLIEFLDTSSGRTALITASDSSLTFSKQFKLTDLDKPAATVIESKGKTLYAASSNGLFSVNLP